MENNTHHRSVMIFIAGEATNETASFVLSVSSTLPDLAFRTAYENEDPYEVEKLILSDTVCFFVETRRKDIATIIAMAKNFYEKDITTKDLFRRIIFFGEENGHEIHLLGSSTMYVINHFNCYYAPNASAQKNSGASYFKFVKDKIPLS